MEVGDIVIIRCEENGGFSTKDMRKLFGGKFGKIKSRIDEVSFCVDIPGTTCYFFSWSTRDLMEARVKMA